MKQAPGFDGLPFDSFSLFQNGLAAPEVDISRGEILQALVIAVMVVMLDKGIDLSPKITGQVVVFQQDTVLQGLVPALDLSLSLRIVWRPSDMTRDGLGLRSSSASGPPDRYRSYQR